MQEKREKEFSENPELICRARFKRLRRGKNIFNRCVLNMLV